MNRQAAEQQVYRTTTVGELVAALVECRDQTDICRVFEHHQGGTTGFEIACQRLGISKADWDYANKEAGFYALVGIVADKLGVPRCDPAAEKTRRETLIGLMKSVQPTNHRTSAGIGSRETPPRVLAAMTEVAKVLAERGYILRSGGARGADSAFEKVAGNAKEIFLPRRGFNEHSSRFHDPSSQATGIAEKYHPAWSGLSDSVRKLMARNTHQVLGRDCDDPVDFVICFTSHGAGAGGTGQAIRIAKDYQLPVIDLGFFEQSTTEQIVIQTLDAVNRAIHRQQPEIGSKEPEPEMNNNKTPYKFVGEKIITYYVDNGCYCLVAYDTVSRRASEPLARSNSREEIERMVASYDDARKTVQNAATRKMKDMFVARSNHHARGPHGPEIER
jgi:hypothetical protein